MRDLQPHPIADLFPMMDDASFGELVEDIAQHGLREPIIMHEGMILDGRNRYRACAEAEIEPHFSDYEGDDPIGFVISLNLKRRHLSTSQRAMIAARLANLAVGSNQHVARISHNNQTGEKYDPPFASASANLRRPTAEKTAEMLAVSPRSIETARDVIKNAIPEVVTAVERGDIAVSAAAKLAKKPTGIQAELMKLPTPKQARQQAIETGRHVADRRGMLQPPVPEVQRKAAQERYKVWWKLRNALDAILELPPPDKVIPTIPEFQHEDVDEWVPQAIEWLNQFKELWNEQREKA